MPRHCYGIDVYAHMLIPEIEVLVACVGADSRGYRIPLHDVGDAYALALANASTLPVGVRCLPQNQRVTRSVERRLLMETVRRSQRKRRHGAGEQAAGETVLPRSARLWKVLPLPAMTARALIDVFHEAYAGEVVTAPSSGTAAIHP